IGPATFARWSLDSTRVIYRSVNSSEWFSYERVSGRATRLGVRHGRLNPSISPDGKMIALDDGRAWRPGTTREGCTCTVYVYDFATGREQQVATNLVAPIWLSPRMLIASEVTPCRGDGCGSDRPMWDPTGDAQVVALDGT